MWEGRGLGGWGAVEESARETARARGQAALCRVQASAALCAVPAWGQGGFPHLHAPHFLALLAQQGLGPARLALGLVAPGGPRGQGAGGQGARADALLSDN